jgi:hypothetical protein
MRQRLALLATLVLGLLSVVGLAQSSPNKNGQRPPGLRGTLVPAGTSILPSGTVLNTNTTLHLSGPMTVWPRRIPS